MTSNEEKMAIERISVIGVPIDICTPDKLEDQVLELLLKPGTKQIVFLNIWDLLKARKRKGDFAECIKSADLILPISKSIIKGAKFLKKPIPHRYNPFKATIQILSIMDSHFKSLYMLGSHQKTLQTAERNVHRTFPNLKIVGRYVGYYPKTMESDIVNSIFKAQPSLVLLGDGIKEKNCWSYRRRNSFSSSIFLYYKDIFGIFSERVNRISDKTFDKGHEIFAEVAHNPFKIFLLFPYMWFILVLVWYRLFKRQ